MGAIRLAIFIVCACGASARLHAQTTATLQGRVFDESGAVIPRATITLQSDGDGFAQIGTTDDEGRYRVIGIPAGVYEVGADAEGFRPQRVEELRIEVARTLVRDFRLAVGSATETVIVQGGTPLIEPAAPMSGHVIPTDTLSDSPLNGRRLTDLGLLAPGAVAPSQNGFSTTPIRGVGALAINIAGNREEAVGFVVNGISTNNLTFGSLSFQPSLESIQEFKVSTLGFGAEQGHVSGAVVNIVTRSGSDSYRGSAFEFFRDEALDARNFFEFTADQPHPFSRHQFGGSFGGPLLSGRTFVFGAYEGLRQQQGLDLNSVVLSDPQRAAVSDPVIQQLVELIPRQNFADIDGTPRFVGAAIADVRSHRWGLDLRHNLSADMRLHAFYSRSDSLAIEPTSAGTSIPGFGHRSDMAGSILTFAFSQTSSAGVLNEVRFGRSALSGRLNPVAGLNPADFGIAAGVDEPIGIPQIVVAGSMTFGGPASYPSGRSDASYVLADSLQIVTGRHSIKVGGEYRTFRNHNFARGTGQFNFPNIPAFIAGTANAFSVTLGTRRNHITQNAASLYVQDGFTPHPRLTLELGARIEAHFAPTERDHQFVVFDAGSASLLRIGVDREHAYRRVNLNLEPRTGIAWSPSPDGETVVRASYSWAADEPGTTAVRDTTGNPPFATPLSATGAIAPGTALATTQPAGLSPVTVDPLFRNASLRAWNISMQRQLARTTVATVGVMGSRGLNLRLTRNLNQPVNGVRPFPTLSAASPIRPGAALGNIMQVESTGYSRYRALWTSVVMRRTRGLQLDGSYTLSRSLDTNSLNSLGFAIQDASNIDGQYGLSDFDARHRVVISASYTFPSARHEWMAGWQLAVIAQAQSGNPVNIVTSDSTINGVANTVRPDLVGPIRIIGAVDQWFDLSAFRAVPRFGSLARNAVLGPGFQVVDASLSKSVALGGVARMELRVDVFNVLNHANLGPPGNMVGSPNFGKITRTRLSTGEAGSSRQIQLAARLSY